MTDQRQTAIDVLVEIATNEDNDQDVRIRAAATILAHSTAQEGAPA